MFPIDIDLNKMIEQTESESEVQSSHIGRSFLFDFSIGEYRVLDGAVSECDELTAIKQWLELLCRTALDKYAVYMDTAFGTSAETFIGRRTLPKGLIAAEIEREIGEGAALNPAIERVGNFSVNRTIRGMEIAFTAYLVNGEELGVSTNV